MATRKNEVTENPSNSFAVLRICKAISIVLGAVIVIFAVTEKVNTNYKNNEIRPMIEQMIESKIGPMRADVKVLYLLKYDEMKADSLRKEKWNFYVRAVDEMYPEHSTNGGAK